MSVSIESAAITSTAVVGNESLPNTKRSIADMFLLSPRKSRGAQVGQLAFTESNSPTFKIGFDRYLQVTKAEDKTATFRIGEWKLLNRVFTRVGFSIELSIAQFLRLTGLLISGEMDLTATDMLQDKEKGRLTPLRHLRESVYIGWSRYNKTNLFSIRKFNTSEKYG